MESLLINGHTALDTVVTVSVKGKDVLNAPRVQLAFALLMEEADGAHFQVVIKVLVTSISVQLMEAESAVKEKDAPSRLLVGPIFVLVMVVASAARYLGATSLPSRLPSFVSNMEVERNASTMGVRKWRVGEPCFVLRMVVVSDVNWRGAIVLQ